MLRAIGEHHYPILLDWFRSHPTPPVAIISDYFLGWTHRLATHLGVPRIMFSPSGAFSISVSFSVWRDLPKIGISPNPDDQDLNFDLSFEQIPNSPIYPWWQLPHNYGQYREGDPDWEFYRNCMLDNLASWGAIFNSYSELEQVYFDHVKKEAGHSRVWAVGPLLPQPNDDDDVFGSTDRGRSGSVPCHEVMTWLENQQDHSVVYVCFGSRVSLTDKQVDELAGALEQSGVRFVWCAKEEEGTTSDGVNARGFEDRVRGRGFLIRGWAPQVAILRHRAVAAFLTHCGWNSVLEGLAAGVVMLTWPMDSDQYTNAKLLVEQLGVGIRVGEGTRDIPCSTKLARILCDTVNRSGAERARAKELSEAAVRAVKGGTSEKDSDDLVNKLVELKNSTNSKAS